jgi:exopolysaccharide biosynthesis polyprenyl glycosylphosphotransferase
VFRNQNIYVSFSPDPGADCDLQLLSLASGVHIFNHNGGLMLRLLGLPLSIWPLLLLTGDLVMFCLSVPIGLGLSREAIESPWLFVTLFRTPVILMGLTYILVLYVANLYDHYQDFRRRENISQIILSSLIGTLLVAILYTSSVRHMIGRNFVEWQGVAFVWLLVLWRYTFSTVALPMRLQRKVLIIGAGRAGQEILKVINQRQNSGLVVAGFLDDNPQKLGTVIGGAPVLGDTGQLDEILSQHKISMVVMAITQTRSSILLNNLVRLSLMGVQLIDMASLYEFLALKIPTDHISDAWLFIHNLSAAKVYYRHFKRLMDLFLASLGLALAWPLGLIIAAAIKVDSPGPVFFRQERLGKDGQPFHIIKFRTMIQDAEKGGPQFADRRDPRVTRVGRILRKTRLDEIPQLYNILKGEMSFIGPRPEREVFIRDFLHPVPDLREGRRVTDPQGCQVLCGYKEHIPYYSYRLLIKPGVTGWAQVMHSYAATLEETKEKLHYDLYYIKNMSLLLDLAILLKTIRIVLFGWGR